MFKSVSRPLGVFIAISLVLCLATRSSAKGEIKTLSKVISEPEAEYVIEVGGTLDPENVEITIENLGDTPVKDPRISVNGFYDWFDINSMVEEITAGCTTDEEKALTIWKWVLWKRFQRSPHDESALHPVRALNCYGYGICGHTASWIKALCRAAGLQARVWEIAGHTVSEVFYNGGWHMLDGNVKVFYLARDNRTIASIAELEKDRLIDYIDVVENVTTRAQDGQNPAIHIKHIQDYELYSRAARFALHIRSPYPAVGGRFWCRLIKEDASKGQASVFYGHPGHGEGNLYTFRWGRGTQDIELDLYPNILKDMPVYHYQIGFALKGSARADPPTQAGVDWFKSVTDFQVSPHSLPALSKGRNVIRYQDNSTGPRKVRITHKWREISDNTAPDRVTGVVSPKNSEEVNTLTPTLEWHAAKDPDKGDSVSDYQVIVSLRPDCRWPLSLSLYRSVGSAVCQWRVPESFLNPGTTYYWKVRARDSRGAVGQWGDVCNFKTSAKAK